MSSRSCHLFLCLIFVSFLASEYYPY